MAKSHPDPTVDLDWTGYVGSIQDIFSRNAKSHPERLCIQETGPPARTFTYQQIDEASNSLSHHFVASGIERGDVIMTYAYRGVELVIAVMGILKAGATFSVLDPSYPALRQIDYLDVSRPRALVSIARATKDAGQLEANVRSFIDSELSLRTEIPSLEILDDGTLLGGAMKGQDILAESERIKAQSANVLVGPDSTPTLSFTSGSEGKPKGVRGRHFSLAYYFSWMAEKFNLSANDRFTMLSGIAHDPIQRDIFTPLFLGARILVPSALDIQYELLAEWMAKYEATIAHLTPAMGQVLVGNAVAKFPKLHHAFFVGDKLLKKDCRALQRLATNVRIVNMYGTTETQRSVSFKELPSSTEDATYLDKLGDHIPAGKGMKNVQLLVVNREDRSKICAVGEEGEIYVRAGGLAEGYLGLPDLSAEKFIPNWFVNPEIWQQEYQESIKSETIVGTWREFYQGPRDRLYRTGDLGKYNDEGDVAATGRADQQIKIRGFRIELGEIDNFISHHPVVRENITVYLETDPRQEQDTLISFFVPEIREWDEWARKKGLQAEPIDHQAGVLDRYHYFEALGKDIRASLGKRLREFEMPRYMVPLPKMPLNPNGKVDRKKLPIDEFFAIPRAALSGVKDPSERVSLTLMEEAVADMWIEVVPSLVKEQLTPSTLYDSIGIHSMLIYSIINSIKQKFAQVRTTRRDFDLYPSLGAFASFLDRRIAGETDDEQVKVVKYAVDAEACVDSLPKTFDRPSYLSAENKLSPVVLLTGATGFLGAYILRELLARSSPATKKVIILVRSRPDKSGLSRIKQTCMAYGIWEETWTTRIECIKSDLNAPRLGISEQDWQFLVREVDSVIHNGAVVHWLQPYSRLRQVNVLSTRDLLVLCGEGKSKQFTFVSSTSVLDSPGFLTAKEPICEDDDLARSRAGLATGYGQTKWASEKLTRTASQRGLKATVVRPGYITGDSKTGVTIEDDFLVRMLKGCIQIGTRPDISNTVNMVPVDHVARVVIAAAFMSLSEAVEVMHVNSHPRLTFNQYLATLSVFGYDVKLVKYDEWRDLVQKYVNNTSAGTESFALLPLYQMVTEDLPGNTIAPELDDKNTSAVLLADKEAAHASRGIGVDEDLIGVYISFLIAVGFLKTPGLSKKSLPPPRLQNGQAEAWSAKVGGRGGR
ncbi:MAG: large subunit of alpha-aminoadipate reductase [Vezdaea aestivalis]|nr:MAG: large subunit of alpha-aminoadipate reductase [Vezdaea aestivalis]